MDPSPPPRDALVFDVARSCTYVGHARDTAERLDVGDLVVAELAAIGDRMAALHLVALIAAGWCAGAKCGADLTDPGASPSGARHCRACRVGWSLVEEDGRLRAVARPWPAGGRPAVTEAGSRLAYARRTVSSPLETGSQRSRGVLGAFAGREKERSGCRTGAACWRQAISTSMASSGPGRCTLRAASRHPRRRTRP